MEKSKKSKIFLIYFYSIYKTNQQSSPSDSGEENISGHRDIKLCYKGRLEIK